MTEEVLVVFKTDYSELETAQQSLAKAGKIDSKSVESFNKAIDKSAKSTNELINEFKSVGTTARRMGKDVENAFGQGIQDALDEAGVSADEFQLALKKSIAPAKSLKQELKDLKEALAQAKVNGKDTTKEFVTMRQRAGELADAISDANAEINNAGSDTRNIDNVIGSISALAGGFAAVQGAAALFGDENEDLQKALLKVNGAMAISQGIQAVYNASLKEGSIAKLADSVATGVQTATQRIYTVVTGQATVATTAFKVALAATGIGLAVIAVVALVQAFKDMGDSIEDVNKGLEAQNTVLDLNIKYLNRKSGIQLQLAKEAGEAESELLKLQGRQLQAEFQLIESANKRLVAQRNGFKATSQQYQILNDQIQTNIDRQEELGSSAQIVASQIRMAKKSEAEDDAKNAKDAAEKQKAFNEKRSQDAIKAAADARSARLAELNDQLAANDKLLLFVKKNTQEEIDLRKKGIQIKRNIDLEGEKLTANQVRLIKAKSYKEQLDLQDEFNARQTDAALTAQIDINKALLSGVQIGNEQRLNLQISNLQALAQLEINAAQENATKILSIQAKLAEDIRNLRNAAIEKQLQDDLKSNELSNDVVNKALSKLANNAKEKADIRIAAQEGITRSALIGVDKEVAANKAKEQSLEDYTAKAQELSDKRIGIELEESAKIAEINEQDKQRRLDNVAQIAQISASYINQIADLASQFSQIAEQQEQQRIDAQKKQVQELLEAGAISEKEALRRSQQLEITERKLRQKQAEREKKEATFKALLAVPQAFLEGLTSGGLPLALIYAALAGAQAAAIISRPVPKFFRGKRDTYEGIGEVGDMGPEIVERKGRMQLYTKPTKTYLGRTDKVYTAAQTRAILHDTDSGIIQPGGSVGGIDYARLAKAIPKSSFNVNIDKDFIEESVSNGLNRNRYFDKRYKFN